MQIWAAGNFCKQYQQVVYEDGIWQTKRQNSKTSDTYQQKEQLIINRAEITSTEEQFMQWRRITEKTEATIDKTDK